MPGGIAAMRESIAERPWIMRIVVDEIHTFSDAFERDASDRHPTDLGRWRTGASS
jgi:hypothetical protein